MKIGVLALQGSFVEHADALRSLGAEVVLVRLPEQLDGLRGIVIPGGESTTIGKLMVRYRLLEKLRALSGQGQASERLGSKRLAGKPLAGKPLAGEPLAGKRLAGQPLAIFGTCAGLILLAQTIEGGSQAGLGIMRITAARNAFGRQLDSFEEDLCIPALGPDPFHGVFIRAPLIVRVEQGVSILARLEDGRIVAARQGKLIVSAFHPELTDDLRLHSYFLAAVDGG